MASVLADKQQRDLAAGRSQNIRLERGRLHRKVAAREIPLSALIIFDHPAIRSVRCYQLVGWMYCVGPGKTTRMLLGLPGHLPLRELKPLQRATLLERVRAREATIAKQVLRRGG